MVAPQRKFIFSPSVVKIPGLKTKLKSKGGMAEGPVLLQWKLSSRVLKQN